MPHVSARFVGLMIALASAAGCTTSPEIERRHYGSWETDIGYTQAVRVGQTLHLSGVTHGGDGMAEQMRGAYAVIANILSDYGVGPDRIVKEVLYTRDIEATKSQIQARKEFYQDDLYPAATWVQIDRLFMEPYLVEIDVTVQLP